MIELLKVGSKDCLNRQSDFFRLLLYSILLPWHSQHHDVLSSTRNPIYLPADHLCFDNHLINPFTTTTLILQRCPRRNRPTGNLHPIHHNLHHRPIKPAPHIPKIPRHPHREERPNNRTRIIPAAQSAPCPPSPPPPHSQTHMFSALVGWYSGKHKKTPVNTVHANATTFSGSPSAVGSRHGPYARVRWRDSFAWMCSATTRP